MFILDMAKRKGSRKSCPCPIFYLSCLSSSVGITDQPL
nr:MAG TPA: hypothetical protein [Caudoviricetes sp.]